MKMLMSQPVKSHRRVLVPPIWVVLLFTGVGIYATNLVYDAVVRGAWRAGILGAILLAIALYVTASPLAASMWSHRIKRSQRSPKVTDLTSN